MIDKKQVLKTLEEKRVMILNDWIQGISKEELHKKYGDFALAVITAQTSKMRNESFVIGE